jgi:hypothetical protein
LAIYCYHLFTNTQQALDLANRRIQDRDTVIYKLQQQVKPTKSTNQNTGAVIASPSNLGRLSPSEESRLKSKGLKNPEADLKDNLLSNQQSVLTQKGTMGGNMAFRDIQILNERYALAYFEDGHNGGYMVLRYEVKPNGQVSWVVLDNYLM